jgi:hypothetical protein
MAKSRQIVFTRLDENGQPVQNAPAIVAPLDATKYTAAPLNGVTDAFGQFRTTVTKVPGAVTVGPVALRCTIAGESADALGNVVNGILGGGAGLFVTTGDLAADIGTYNALAGPGNLRAWFQRGLNLSGVGTNAVRWGSVINPNGPAFTLRADAAAAAATFDGLGRSTGVNALECAGYANLPGAGGRWGVVATRPNVVQGNGALLSIGRMAQGAPVENTDANTVMLCEDGGLYTMPVAGSDAYSRPNGLNALSGVNWRGRTAHLAAELTADRVHLLAWGNRDLGVEAGRRYPATLDLLPADAGRVMYLMPGSNNYWVAPTGGVDVVYATDGLPSRAKMRALNTLLKVYGGVADDVEPLVVFPGDSIQVRQGIYGKGPRLESVCTPAGYVGAITIVGRGIEGIGYSEAPQGSKAEALNQGIPYVLGTQSPLGVDGQFDYLWSRADHSARTYVQYAPWEGVNQAIVPADYYAFGALFMGLRAFWLGQGVPHFDVALGLPPARRPNIGAAATVRAGAVAAQAAMRVGPDHALLGGAYRDGGEAIDQDWNGVHANNYESMGTGSTADAGGSLHDTRELYPANTAVVRAGLVAAGLLSNAAQPEFDYIEWLTGPAAGAAVVANTGGGAQDLDVPVTYRLRLGGAAGAIVTPAGVTVTLVVSARTTAAVAAGMNFRVKANAPDASPWLAMLHAEKGSTFVNSTIRAGTVVQSNVVYGVGPVASVDPVDPFKVPPGATGSTFQVPKTVARNAAGDALNPATLDWSWEDNTGNTPTGSLDNATGLFTRGASEGQRAVKVQAKRSGTAEGVVQSGTGVFYNDKNGTGWFAQFFWASNNVTLPAGVPTNVTDASNPLGLALTDVLGGPNVSHTTITSIDWSANGGPPAGWVITNNGLTITPPAAGAVWNGAYPQASKGGLAHGPSNGAANFTSI